MKSDAPGPLGGLRVLELGGFVSAPFCGMILGDMGAEVLKVEPPGGDPFRKWGGEGDFNPFFWSMNKNKRSIIVDLKKDEGKEILFRLAERADVIIENFRPGTMADLGIGYDRLRETNGSLIYCGISAFGLGGVYSHKPGYDTIGQAMSGLLSLLTDLSSPQPVGISLSDHLAGLFAACGILAALNERGRSGEGQMVDTSLLQSSIYFVGEHVGMLNVTGKSPTRDDRVRNAQAFAFLASDGLPFVIHLSSPEKFWKGIVKAVERTELLADSRFNTYGQRMKNYDELRSELASIFRTKSRESWLKQLEENDVPAAPIFNLKEVFADPQVEYLNLVDDVYSGRSKTKLVKGAVNFSRHKAEIRYAPPTLGQHTLETLEELGYKENDISALKGSGVVQ